MATRGATAHTLVVDRQIRVLLVEESETDARLATIALRRAGFTMEAERVQDAAGLAAALGRGPWDVVLTDWSATGTTALEVLEVVNRTSPGLPVIVVSGIGGEDVAVDAMHAGAADFVVKHKLSRLPIAVERELRARPAGRG
jgi:DNA-binding NtrC family response regulator